MGAQGVCEIGTGDNRLPGQGLSARMWFPETPAEASRGERAGLPVPQAATEPGLAHPSWCRALPVAARKCSVTTEQGPRCLPHTRRSLGLQSRPGLSCPSATDRASHARRKSRVSRTFSGSYGQVSPEGIYLPAAVLRPPATVGVPGDPWVCSHSQGSSEPALTYTQTRTWLPWGS